LRFRGADLNRWCPSCRKGWPADRVVCPDCLVDLVEDLAATARCGHCSRSWPARMQSCPVCLAELRPDPVVAADALGAILALGGHLYRPEGVPPFADGPSCTLLRLSARGNLVFIGANGLVEASVSGSDGRAVPPLTCRDHDGTVLFRLVSYEAAERAVVAVAADGAALATFLRVGAGIDVRDETSAPVATLARARGRYDLVETGGRKLAGLGSADAELEGWVDDQWWLQSTPGGRPLPLRPFAAVALVLAVKVLLGRPWPERVGPGPAEEADDSRPWPFG